MKKILILLILISPAFTAVAQQEATLPVKVMTFNVRFNNPEDAPNDWPNRKAFVGELLQYYAPDIIGTQEVLHDQLEDIQKMLPNYAYLGVARDDGKKEGEYSAIFYNQKHFEVLASSTFWLSEDPDKIGVKGWDAVCNRVVTWGKFKDRKSGEQFYVFNTHFDHAGQVARQKSAALLLSKVKAIAGNKKAVITGDFNADPDSQVYQKLTSKPNGLTDVKNFAPNPYGPQWTSHGFGKQPVETRHRIDYIFSNFSPVVSQYVVISEQRGAVFPSDHLPVLAEIEL